MARKIVVDLVDAVGTFMAKTNVMSDYIGDLDDLDSEYSRLRDIGVEFTQSPLEAGDVKMAVLDDTCGNLIQLIQMLDRDS